MHEAECTVKNLGLLVGITSLKAVMDLTGEPFNLSKKSDRGNDMMFWHPLVFLVAILWGLVGFIYISRQVSRTLLHVVTCLLASTKHHVLLGIWAKIAARHTTNVLI